MFKYIKFTKVKTEYTTLTFNQQKDDVKVNHFGNTTVVSIEADSEEAIAELVNSQATEISCLYITKEEFIAEAIKSPQYERIKEVAEISFIEAVKPITKKYCKEERETFGFQIEESKEILENGATETTFITPLAQNREMTIQDYSLLVQQKAEEQKIFTAQKLVAKTKLKSDMLKKIGF